MIAEPLAEPLLAGTARVTVDVCRVDEVDTVFPGGIEQFVCFLSVRFDDATRFIGEAPGSKAESRYLCARRAELCVFHTSRHRRPIEKVYRQQWVWLYRRGTTRRCESVAKLSSVSASTSPSPGRYATNPLVSFQTRGPASIPILERSFWWRVPLFTTIVRVVAEYLAGVMDVEPPTVVGTHPIEDIEIDGLVLQTQIDHVGVIAP